MPRQVGSVIPSSRQLAGRMAREVAEFLAAPNGGRLIEVGAGTGARRTGGVVCISGGVFPGCMSWKG